MAQYKIVANGADMGTYEGESEARALVAYAHDAGYASIEAACQALGLEIEDWLAQLRITEVTAD